MPNSIERRRFWRSVFHAPARVKLPGLVCPVVVEDISLKGAMIVYDGKGDLSAGQTCQLQIELSSEVMIEMDCSVAHIEGHHIGLQCEKIELESMTHLRQLVEHNALDPSVLDRNLAMLVAGR
jgi:hypothetical protein